MEHFCAQMAEVLYLLEVSEARETSSNRADPQHFRSQRHLAWFLPRVLPVLHFFRPDGLHFQAWIANPHPFRLDANLFEALLPIVFLPF